MKTGHLFGGLEPLTTTGPVERGGMRTACGVNAAPFYGTAYDKGSASHSVDKHEPQLAEDQIPVLTPGMPVLHDPLCSQIEHPP